MTEKPATTRSEAGLTDPATFMRNMARVMDQAAKIMAARPAAERGGQDMPTSDAATMAKAFQDVAQSYMSDPQKLVDAQFKLWQQYSDLWQNSWRRFLGEPAKATVQPGRGDKRFTDRDWEDNQIFDFLKQSYLIATRWANDVVQDATQLDDRTRQQASFYVEQLANAMSPSNFALTNPEVLRATLASNGQNLVEGMQHLAEDMAAGGGELRIKQTDMEAFEIGRNIATTPGKVVFQNEVMQLIQYEPSTETVFSRPLLIVPPWINKFYILDLNAQKSFIRWAVAQGLTVFVISWVNPDERLGMKTFGDYMKDGVLAALDAVEAATGQREINTIGYCVGGTLMATTLGYMAAKGDDRIKSTTFFATQVDFEKAGDLLVFIDEEQIASLERRMAERGYLDGGKMANTFNMLRSNDLIWSYVVNNYLLGRNPLPFDLLYWNADATRMPAALHSYYLRECYLNNRLAKGEMVIDGVQINLSKAKQPIYNLVTREDHIAPLPSGFRVGQKMGGDTRLVVAGSGHIAGVVNPPEAHKYSYWTSVNGGDTPEAWLQSASEHEGSWWPDWFKWIEAQSGDRVPARTPGDGKLKPIEDAPGLYVRVRS
ncbi:polyhydroxyalkanoate synthase [Rhodoligotrophos appendicifer]|uniref:PHA/PHB synthase family protein n=1 Tax=Rhodoligotrophos appendicifer TaxID=987056 RepID=UPI001185541F|nr:class I poly(R)-hydroxyalkanoic acid synthase [Rhodoligotrophos appendicifer]